MAHAGSDTTASARGNTPFTIPHESPAHQRQYRAATSHAASLAASPLGQTRKWDALIGTAAPCPAFDRHVLLLFERRRLGGLDHCVAAVVRRVALCLFRPMILRK